MTHFATGIKIAKCDLEKRAVCRHPGRQMKLALGSEDARLAAAISTLTPVTPAPTIRQSIG